MATNKKIKSEYTRQWILETGIPILLSYNGNLTLRALHYRLVAAGMTNDTRHYKKVVDAFTVARWTGDVEFDAFLDHERAVIGSTDYAETDVDTAVNEAKDAIRAWARYYSKNRWENQENYVEVFIEKKALQGVFDRPCRNAGVALSACKGYPSLTFQYDAKQRFDAAIDAGKNPIILYFGDYDCSGEDIPRSIGDTLERMGTTVEVRRIALMESQVLEWNLPPAPTKETDSRAVRWAGIGQVELDAVEPSQIVRLLTDALEEVFDADLYRELREIEELEQDEYKNILKRDFATLLD